MSDNKGYSQTKPSPSYDKTSPTEQCTWFQIFSTTVLVLILVLVTVVSYFVIQNALHMAAAKSKAMKALHEKAQQMSATEKALKAKEDILKLRENKLLESEQDQLIRPTISKAQPSEDLDRISKKGRSDKEKATLLKLGRTLGEKENQLKIEEVNLLEKMRILDEREKNVNKQRQLLHDREEALKKKEQDLNEKEERLKKKEEELKLKEQSLITKPKESKETLKEKTTKYLNKTIPIALSASEKQATLDYHNYYRSQVARGLVPKQPPGADLVLMEWDERASSNAGKWMSTCSDGHNAYHDRKFGSYNYVGQNIAYWSWAGVNISKGVEMWYDEYQYYDYQKKACSKVCGHYTQVMWSNTAVVGCGKASCPNWKTQAACDYADAGNFNNRHPYKVGTACSQCPANYPKCHQGLCATVAQCSVPDIVCTKSTTVGQSIKLEATINPDKIIARVLDKKP